MRLNHSSPAVATGMEENGQVKATDPFSFEKVQTNYKIQNLAQVRVTFILESLSLIFASYWLLLEPKGVLSKDLQPKHEPDVCKAMITESINVQMCEEKGHVD